VITLNLAQYDPTWPEQFEAHRKRIASALRDRATRIEHIGSTSVPGLAAKPVIDLIVDGVKPDDPAVRDALRGAGYDIVVDEAGHAMFATADRSAHVHIWAGSEEVERHLLFRDWLRTHPEDCALYEHVKREFVKREWETQNHYAEAKTAVVNTIMRRARGEGSGPRVQRFVSVLQYYLPRHARVLEIGAGEGLLAAGLAAAGHDVVALDTQLRSMFPVVETSFEEYEAQPQSFDCIVAQLVLHHAHDLNGMLEKIDGLLKLDGVIAIDDYGWERSDDPAFRADRSDLHTSETMLRALRKRFEQLFYADHAYFNEGAGDDSLAFTFIGRRR
jgi:GrpB-like predicted nucleotidyltransferase (UPF0157 family)